MSNLRASSMNTSFWKGIIVAEAATVFKRNQSKTLETECSSLEGAKTWVEEQVKILLEEEEEISEAMVVGANSLELCPSSWGSTPLWKEP